jgi:hypothetical protein
MNPIDHQLNRLFRAASQAKEESLVTPPYGLETRVMAAWRSASPFGFWDMGLLIRGLVMAVLVMSVSLWPSLRNANTVSTNPFSDSLQLAYSDTTVPFDGTP